MLFKRLRKKIAKGIPCFSHPKTIAVDDDSYKKVIVEEEDSNSNATLVIEETIIEDGEKDSITDEEDNKQAESEKELPPGNQAQTDNAPEKPTHVNLEIRLHPEWEHYKEDMLRIFRCLTDQSFSINNILKNLSEFPLYFKEFEDKLQAFQYSLQNIILDGCQQQNSRYEDTLESRTPEEHDERYGSLPNPYSYEVFSTETNHLKDQFDELQQYAEKMQSTCDDHSFNSAISERVFEMNNEIKRLPIHSKLSNHVLRSPSFSEAGYIKPKGPKTQTQKFENIEMKTLSVNGRPTWYDSSTRESKM